MQRPLVFLALQKSEERKIEVANVTDEMEIAAAVRDDDVRAEALKVNEIFSKPIRKLPVVLVHDLRKEYVDGRWRKKEDHVVTVAIKHLSLAVESGEVFGLLGHNGAGKTTTLRIIVAEESPTKGTVQIEGHSITSNLVDALKLVGYCPQFDAIWNDITVKEHLECYAAIRGVPPGLVSKVVHWFLTNLHIEQHAGKKTSKCSGGTNRKLSYALAMVGNPKLVLLDEPSRGMDPTSKRFLWDMIVATVESSSRSAILTTHAMEEAEAICSRIGIMVQGELMCLGTCQHLKDKYGAGYDLEVRLERDHKSSKLRRFVARLFPNSNLVEHFGNHFVFGVPQNDVSSLARCFDKLEAARTKLHIDEYSFSQTTLEQVFLRFARYSPTDATRNKY